MQKVSSMPDLNLQPNWDISKTVEISAPIEDVFNLVSDVTNTGLWSPECITCATTEKSTQLREGDFFLGYNRSGANKWTTKCVVTKFHPASRFEFAVVNFHDGHFYGTFASENQISETQLRWGFKATPKTREVTLLCQYMQLETISPFFAEILNSHLDPQAALESREMEIQSSIEESLQKIRDHFHQSF